MLGPSPVVRLPDDAGWRLDKRPLLPTGPSGWGRFSRRCNAIRGLPGVWWGIYDIYIYCIYLYNVWILIVTSTYIIIFRKWYGPWLLSSGYNNKMQQSSQFPREGFSLGPEFLWVLGHFLWVASLTRSFIVRHWHIAWDTQMPSLPWRLCLCKGASALPATQRDLPVTRRTCKGPWWYQVLVGVWRRHPKSPIFG